MNFDLHSRSSVILIYILMVLSSHYTRVCQHIASFIYLLTFYLAALSVAQTIMGTPGEVTSVGGVGCEEIHATL